MTGSAGFTGPAPESIYRVFRFGQDLGNFCERFGQAIPGNKVGIDGAIRLGLRSIRVWKDKPSLTVFSNGCVLREPIVANFFLIDHSLRQSGGHHFDYVSCVARAANELGFLTTIGANRSLKKLSASDQASIRKLGNVKRVFRQTTYQPDSYLAGLQHLTRSDCGSVLREESGQRRFPHLYQSLKNYRHRQRRKKFIRQFAFDCQRYFQSLMQTEGDHAFLTTVSELELMGLAAYLSRHPQSIQTHWHLQFHFNLFDGRTPEYVGQEYIAQAIRACFLAALTKLAYHRVSFYTTSETLADQYNRLGVGEFHVLPYPVSPRFAADGADERPGLFDESDLAQAIQNSGQSAHSRSHSPGGCTVGPIKSKALAIESGQTTNRQRGTGEPCAVGVTSGRVEAPSEFTRPLRITCPGEVRREKGHVDYLQPLVDEIYPNYLATGQVQIIVQRPARKWPAKKQKIELALPGDATETSYPPVEYFSHPLSQEDYVDLIKKSDCGLLFYDSRVYFSRRAGVLGELLSCGKPVIVPAGSWLAEQIQEPIFRHVDGVSASARVARIIPANEFNWDSRNVPASGGVLSFDHGQHPFEFSLNRESGEDTCVVKFDWHWPESAGVYCRIELTQKDSSGAVLDNRSRVVGFRKSLGQVNALFRISPGAHSVEFSLTNAFHDSTANIRRVSVEMLSTYEKGSGEKGSGSIPGPPIGQVGVVASDLEDLPNCVDEIVQNFDHYRDSAMAFSSAWYARHEPRRTVNHLVMATKQPNLRAA